MVLYQYRARTPQGRVMEGTIDARDQREAARILRGRGLLVTSITAGRFSGSGSLARPGAVRRGRGRREPRPRAVPMARDVGGRGVRLMFSRRVGLKDLALFCRQFTTMVSAGVSILVSLNILARQMASRRMRVALTQVIRAVEQGQSLSEAFRGRPDVFPPILVNMVAAGEAGGMLEETFERLADHFEKEHAVSQKIRSAMTYPAVVSVVAVGVVAFMIVFVLPSFVGIFTTIGAELPGPTKFLLAVSNAIRAFWYVLVGGVVFLAVTWRLIASTERGAYILDFLALRLPVFGDLVLKRAVSRFCRTLGALLRSGVPLLVSMSVVQQTVGNRPVAAALVSAEEEIRAGRGLVEPLRGSRLFPQMVLEMVAVGEETGAIDQMLMRVADFYDKEIDTAVERLSSMVEPVIIVFLGGVVGFILLSLIMPMFDIYSQMQL